LRQTVEKRFCRAHGRSVETVNAPILAANNPVKPGPAPSSITRKFLRGDEEEQEEDDDEEEEAEAEEEVKDGMAFERD